MSRGKNELDRAALLRWIDRELGRKADMAIVMFQTAVAERLGLGLTDLFCGELLSRTGPITAGELADVTGLTTGAITGVIDRLEKNGFAQRENDPQDRRRVLVRALPDRWAELGEPLYRGVNQRFADLHAAYSDDELATIADYIDNMSKVYDEEAIRLRLGDEKAASVSREGGGSANLHADARAEVDMNAEALITIHIPKGKKEMTTPLRDVKVGRLEWVSGPSEVHLSAARDGSDLYRARFAGEIPTVRIQEGNVAIQYRQRTLFGRAGGSANVTLNASVPWTMDLRSDASKIEADLRELTLRELMLRTNSSKILLNLPAPNGTVTLRIESNSSKVTIQRPSGVPARVELDGNWSKLTFDKHNKGAIRTEAVESPGYKRAEARYLIQIVGGSNQIRVDSV